MSIVNLKIIFVKKRKQTRERPTRGRGATFIYNKNARFHNRDGLFVRVRRFDNSRQVGNNIFENGMVLILNEQCA